MPLATKIYLISKTKAVSFLIQSGEALLASDVCPLLKLLGLKLAVLRHHYIPRGFSEDFSKAFLTIVRKISPRSICVSGTGSLVLKSERDTYYLSASPLSILSIRKSYYAWRSIRRTTLKSVVPSHWQEIALNGQSLWCVETLYNSCSSDIGKAREVLVLLWSYGYSSLIPLKDIRKWKETVRFFLCGDSLQKWIVRIEKLGAETWQLGPRHGDLTDKNILFRSATPVLIDLDRFTWKGIQIFDLIHFDIERSAKSLQTDWFAVAVPSVFRGLIAAWWQDACLIRHSVQLPIRSADDLCELYILERLSLELRLDTPPPSSWFDKAEKLLFQAIDS
ncbi:MAG: hypothetical protein AAFN38_24640 [Cyanobacteria bacterium J06560_5]